MTSCVNLSVGANRGENHSTWLFQSRQRERKALLKPSKASEGRGCGKQRDLGGEAEDVLSQHIQFRQRRRRLSSTICKPLGQEAKEKLQAGKARMNALSGWSVSRYLALPVFYMRGTHGSIIASCSLRGMSLHTQRHLLLSLIDLNAGWGRQRAREANFFS